MYTIKIITISGKAGAGKDTFARLLQKQLSLFDYKTLIVHYADKLKFVCERYYGWDGKKDEAGRKLLQKVGTELYRENLWEDYWVYGVALDLKMMEVAGVMPDFVLIPDTRFPNEIEVMEDVFGEGSVIAVNVTRDTQLLDGEAAQHSSETAMDDYQFSIVIENNSTLEALEEKAAGLVAQINELLEV